MANRKVNIGILLIIIVGCFSCKGSHTSSFENLQSAFIDWYFKYHPVKALGYNWSTNAGGFRSFDSSSREEYTADVSRFLIELSQIDATKLSDAERIDYNILFTRLESLKYELEVLRSWEWNPLFVLNEVYEGLFLVSETPDLEMSYRVETAASQLAQLPYVLETASSQILWNSMIHKTQVEEFIEGIITLLEELPLKLNADNLTLDDIDRKIEESIIALEDYGDFILENKSQKDKKVFPQDFPLDASAFTLYSGGRYQLEKVVRTAEKKVIPLENRIFHLALPLYLQDHDEPVWLDRDDTLEVIRWVLQSTRNNPLDMVASEQVLSQFYNSLSELEAFLYAENLFPHRSHASIHLEFAPSYSPGSQPAFLYHFYPKNKTREMVYYIRQTDEAEAKYPMSKKEIDLFNGMKILPGFALQWSQAQRQTSLIRYLFPAEITLYGWQQYAVNMLIEEGFGDWETEYHILKLAEELELVISALTEVLYYKGDLTREAAKSALLKKAYLTDTKAERKIMAMENQYFSHSLTFIGLMEFKSMVHEYKIKMADEFNLAEFHRLILQAGIIPIHELKKLL